MWRDYDAKIKFTEPLLGVVPKDPEVYATWVALKKAERKALEAESEEDHPEFVEEKSWTGFFTDDSGLYLKDYQLKGFFKEVAAIRPGVLKLMRASTEKRPGGLYASAYIRGRLDVWLFVKPRNVYLGHTKPGGVIERPLRADGVRGKRVTLARSDYVPAGTEIGFKVRVLDDSPIKQEHILDWMLYAEEFGLGQFRTGGYGRFEVLSLKVCHS